MTPGEALTERHLLELSVQRALLPEVRRFMAGVRDDALAAQDSPLLLASGFEPFARWAVAQRWAAVAERAVAALAGLLDADGLALVRDRVLRSSIADELFGDVAEVLREARDEAWSASRLADTLAERMDISRAAEVAARRIARTEATWARNRDALRRIALDPRYTRKRWVAHHDKVTRDTHLAADGQTVGLSEQFRVGEALMMQPADMSAPIGETANCRCVVVGAGPPVISLIEATALIVGKTLTAGFNPAQARVPRGNPAGGQWIDTPSGILREALPGRAARNAMPYTLKPAAIRDLDPMAETRERGLRPAHDPARWSKRLRKRKKQNRDVAKVAKDAANREQIEALRQQLVEESKGPVMTAMHADKVQFLLESGQLKTPFDEGVTSPWARGDYLKGRAYVEEVIQGAPPGQHPLYGYIPKDATDFPHGYGAFQLVLDPAVRDRSTITFGDSYVNVLTPTPLAGIEEVHVRKLLGARNNADLLGEVRPPEYNEVQIHGGLKASDIIGVIVDRNAAPPRGMDPAAHRALIEQQAKALEDAGYRVEWVE